MLKNGIMTSVICVLLLASPFSLPAADLKFFSFDPISDNPHASLLRAPSLNALYLYSVEKNRHYMAYDFGVKIPGISLRGGSVDVDIGGYGGIFTRFELFSESFNFVHADFSGGLFTDVRYRDLLFETSVYHTSSHLGDDYIRYNYGVVRNTGFEAIRHYTTYIMHCVQFSLGFDWKFSRRPERKIFREPSVLAGARIDLLPEDIPFFIEMEVEIITGRRLPNIGIRAGIYLKRLFTLLFLGRNSSGKEAHELSVYYYNGYSKMGCFYDRRETLILVGPSSRF